MKIHTTNSPLHELIKSANRLGMLFTVETNKESRYFNYSHNTDTYIIGEDRKYTFIVWDGRPDEVMNNSKEKIARGILNDCQGDK